MDECDNPSEDTIQKTTCNSSTCPIVKEGNYDETKGGVLFGSQWFRVPGGNLLYFGTGTYDRGGLKTLDEKVKYKKQVSVDTSKKAGIDERKKIDNDNMKKDFKEKFGK